MGSKAASRAKRAVDAMKALGFQGSKIVPVLKILLKACENDWKHIESENYRLLVESIFEADSPETCSKEDEDVKKRKKAREEEVEPHRKRQMESRQDKAALPAYVLTENISPLKAPKLEIDDSPVISTPVENRSGLLYSKDKHKYNTRRDHMTASASHVQEEFELGADHQKKVVSEVLSQTEVQTQSQTHCPLANNISPTKVTTTESLIHPRVDTHYSSARKEAAQQDIHEPIACEPLSVEFPVLMIHPPPTLPIIEEEGDTNMPSPTQTFNGDCYESDPNHTMEKDESATTITKVEDSTNSIEIASSADGEKKVSLLFNVPDLPQFHFPSIESVLKRVEDKCLRSYMILNPSISLIGIMNEVCKSVLELGTPHTDDHQEEPSGSMAIGLSSCDEAYKRKGKAVNGAPHPSSALALVPQHEPAFGSIRPVHDINDICKGEETVRIPIVNDFPGQQCPTHFTYIPHSIIYQNAYLNFSLARMGDEDYCSDCYNNCLLASIPCACARETGGEFAYMPGGLLKEKFLDDCIAMCRDGAPKNRIFYCKDCPIERAKNDAFPDKCKGHLVRKFIKECWRKCGCHKQCGNRVVQQGIWCNLQVFWTGTRKGWGLRCTDDLPRGAFVCEYVGEVLTNMELYDRTLKMGNTKHTYPILLDADWGSEGVLKDEEALCLDATFYGNVARFINHRCYDANLVEIPVEVETPDRHYYHVAFFTARKIDAFEELTWDYGIDFDDHEHPVKAFQCLCDSMECRDKSRSKGKRSVGITIH
ncbi:putative inactive histone-lysine N-methyltransferase SUVR2 [Wolffia australiana]